MRWILLWASLLAICACSGSNGSNSCESRNDCTNGDVCVAGTCRSICQTDDDCTEGVCVDSVCLPIPDPSDPQYCSLAGPKIASIPELSIERDALVTITGSGFDPSTTVTFDGNEPIFEVINSSTIYALLPGGLHNTICQGTAQCAMHVIVAHHNCSDSTALQLRNEPTTFVSNYTGGTSSGFGKGLANLGDLDGDGASEIAIRDAATNEVFVVSPWFDVGTTVLPWWRFDLATNGCGTHDEEAYNNNFTHLPDLDGDNYKELAVGGGTNVCVISGFSGALLVNIDGAGKTTFGHSMTSVPDVDSDGVDELMVCTPSLVSSGECTIYSGLILAQGAPLPLLTITPPAVGNEYNGARFGIAATRANDHVIIGSPAFMSEFSPGTLTRSGRLDVYSFSTAPAAVHVLSIDGEPVRSLGSTIVSGHDMDGDGTEDFAARRSGTSGQARIFSGATFNELFVFIPQNGQLDLGKSMALVTDATGDGFADLAMGNPTYEDLTTSEQTGRVVLSDAQGGTTVISTAAIPNTRHIGYAVVDAGDLNDDGRGEICIAAPGDGNVPSVVSCRSAF